MQKKQCGSPKEGLGKAGPPPPKTMLAAERSGLGQTKKTLLLAVLAGGCMHLPILFWGEGGSRTLCPSLTCIVFFANTGPAFYVFSLCFVARLPCFHTLLTYTGPLSLLACTRTANTQRYNGTLKLTDYFDKLFLQRTDHYSSPLQKCSCQNDSVT